MSSEEELQEKARMRIGEADSDAEKDDDSTEHDGDVTVTSSPCASVSSSCTKLHVCGTASRGNRQMSACSSHSNSTTSLDSFVVVHTELVHPSLAIDEAEELAAERKALCSSHEESSTDSATGGAAGENQTSKDAEMNRMLLDAYTKLTKTMASSAKAKTRSISASVDAPTSSSSSFESTANGKDAEQREDVATAASVNTSASKTVQCDSIAANSAEITDVNMPRVSLVRAPERGVTRKTLPESDLDSLDEMEGRLPQLGQVRRTAHAHYRHRPNRRVDWALNELVRVAVVLVLGMLIGKFGCLAPATVTEAFERSASSHLEQLKGMHDELVACLKRSGQLELALHDARSTMVQREYVEKWESLYDEAKERNDALEQSYQTYKGRYLLAAAGQRSLRRLLADVQLRAARLALRNVQLELLLRDTGLSHKVLVNQSSVASPDQLLPDSSASQFTTSPDVVNVLEDNSVVSNCVSDADAHNACSKDLRTEDELRNYQSNRKLMGQETGKTFARRVEQEQSASEPEDEEEEERLRDRAKEELKRRKRDDSRLQSRRKVG